MTLVIKSHSTKETEALAAKLASKLAAGDVVELRSDVGGGKTTFVKGLVAALGSTDHVSSPTFTVSKQYTAKKYRIVHFDFYRLHEPTYVADALAETMSDDKTITFIEWAGLVESVLPASRLIVDIQKHPSNESQRTFSFDDKTIDQHLTLDIPS